MAMRFGDLLEEFVDYTDGVLVLRGPLPGRRPFGAVLSDGDTVFVRLESIGTPDEWMLATAYYYASDPPEIGIDRVIASSADGGFVEFTAGATAACVQPAVSVVAVSGDGPAPSVDNGRDCVAAGAGAVVSADRSTAFGARAQGAYEGAVAIGCDALASAGNGIAIGIGAQAVTGWGAVAVGDRARAEYYESIALGGRARAWADHVMAVGPAAFTWSVAELFVRDGGGGVVVPPNTALLADLYLVMYAESGDIWSGKASVCVHRDGEGPLVFAGGLAPSITAVAGTEGAGFTAHLLADPEGFDTGTLYVGMACTYDGYCWFSMSLTGVTVARF